MKFVACSKRNKRKSRMRLRQTAAMVGNAFFKSYRHSNVGTPLRAIALQASGIRKNNFCCFSELFQPLPTRSNLLCTLPVISCWNCNYGYSDDQHGEVHFFCPSCEIVQEPMVTRTYFDIMNCQQAFDLDVHYLTQQYRKLQSQLHPDKFSLKSEVEQTFSNLQSSLVNEAYQTLLRPLTRGLYMLQLNGITIEEGSVSGDVKFLSEIMEMNETLESANEESLKKLRNQNQGNIDLCTRKASEAFKNDDLLAAKEILSRMKFYNNVNEQIREKLTE